MIKKLLPLFLVAIVSYSPTQASTVVYQPIIPDFGGNPYNWSGLLTEADKQNIYHAPTKPSETLTPLDRFKEQLQYMILSRLATEIVNAAFGSETLSPGTYQIENYQVTVQQQGGEIHVNIVDTSTGSSTEVIVPMYSTSP
ncbi:curli production assembly/transport component CsgF [Thermovibrio sp.]